MTDLAHRILVTGASGFIGRQAVATFTGEHRHVTAAVRRPSPFPTAVRVSQISDIGPDTDWQQALGGCDAVVHLAGRVHVMRDTSTDALATYRRVNTAGTLALARQAAAMGVRRFVFVSSIKVNGEATRPGEAFDENDPPAPTDPYGVSKSEAESGLLTLGRELNMEVVVVRPPLVYGPGVGANFGSMIRWLKRRVPLPFGRLTGNRRSLIGIDNLVDLIRRCLDHPAAAGQVFLAADGEDLSTAELLRRTAAALGIAARLYPVPTFALKTAAVCVGQLPAIQRLIDSLQVDIGKAHRVLGWRPPLTVADSLRRAVRPHRPDSP